MDQTILDKLIADIKALGTLTPSDEKLTTMKGLYDTIAAGITQVEIISKDISDGISGSDKKSFVIAVVDEFVKLPFIPQWLMNDFLSYGIDLLINFLNTKLGKNWVVAIPAGPAPTVPPAA